MLNARWRPSRVSPCSFSFSSMPASICSIFDRSSLSVFVNSSPSTLRIATICDRNFLPRFDWETACATRANRRRSAPDTGDEVFAAGAETEDTEQGCLFGEPCGFGSFLSELLPLFSQGLHAFLLGLPVRGDLLPDAALLPAHRQQLVLERESAGDVFGFREPLVDQRGDLVECGDWSCSLRMSCTRSLRRPSIASHHWFRCSTVIRGLLHFGLDCLAGLLQGPFDSANWSRPKKSTLAAGPLVAVSRRKPVAG